jgi:DNA-binding MarR family transcriptional regulator
MKREKTIDHALRATWQSVAKAYNEQAQKHDSTMAIAMALLYIDFDYGTSSTALGPSMGMEATSLSRLLKNMENKGLVVREKNPDDGRGMIVKLTATGKEKRQVSKDSVLQFNNKIKEKVPAFKIEHFFEVTDMINRLIADKAIF